MSGDPIGLVGGSNLFVYTSNNPIAFSDPEGLFPLQGFGLVAGALLGATSAGGGAAAAGGSLTQVGIASAVGAVLGGASAAINAGALFTGGVNMAASAAGQMIAGKGALDVNLTLLATSALSASGVMGVGNLVREAMAGSWLTQGVGVVAVGQASLPTRAAAGLLGKNLPLTLRDLGNWLGSGNSKCPGAEGGSGVPIPGPFAP